jgi:6,7-dimethyl-8-ribityllumazine synthase
MAHPSPHIMVIEARFYEDLADEMLRGAEQALKRAGASYEIFSVPGAFEIPAAVHQAVRAMDFDPKRRRFDGYVALGCVIRGETTHYDYVCQESARGLMDLSTRYALAMGYGILTCENDAQAWARAAVDKGDKGGVAVNACLHMVGIKNRLGLYPR